MRECPEESLSCDVTSKSRFYFPSVNQCVFLVYRMHRRRIKTKEKAKVVPAVWAILHQDDLK